MKKIFLACIILTSICISATEVAKDIATLNMNAKKAFDMRNYAKLSITKDENKAVFVADGLCILISNQSFKVKPNTKYQVSVKAKSLNTTPTFMLLGLAPFDAKCRLLGHINFDGVQATLTELSRPCNAKDKVIYVKDASKWQGTNRSIAFDAKADKSDIPNFNVSNSQVIKVEEVEEDNTWKITFNYPIGFTRPAGTLVRMHRFGGTYHYTKSCDVQDKWTTIAGNNFNSKQFRKGTVSAKAVILCNYGAKGAKGRMAFNELVVKEISEK